MSLPDRWAERLRLPIICAPMYCVSNPELVIAARNAGIIGALPRANAPTFDVFENWLSRIDSASRQLGERKPPPLAVNLSTRLEPQEMERHLAACRRHGVELIISAKGDPTTLIKRARDHGLHVFSDAVTLRFAEKAISAGASGVIAIGSGGGGHSGTINHLTLVAAIRRGFSGTIVMAGAIANGAAVRAAEILGADAAYLGTRFIATNESGAPDEYKQMLVAAKANDLLYTSNINGVHANWLKPSLRSHGLDPEALPARIPGERGFGHLPAAVTPWSNLWSAGQGVEQIDDIQPVGTLVARLEREYRQACELPPFHST